MYLSDRNTRIASLIFNIFCVKSLLKKVVDPHVWSQARIRMHTDRRDRGERKKYTSPLNFRRKQQQKNPLAPRVSGGMLSQEIFYILTP